MPDFLKIILLSILQGLTEFLPVSSSGHLGLGQHFLGLDAPGVILEVTTHAGTLLSVIIYYRKRLLDLTRRGFRLEPQALRTVGLLMLGVLPVCVLGLLAQGTLEPLFRQPHFIASMLICTGLILLSLYRLREQPVQPVGWRSALLIGIAQMAALLPGISRSGTTITVARHLGIGATEAAEFSLLMMIPAILGATAVSAVEAGRSGIGSLTYPQLGVAFVVSAAVGYAAICLLVSTLSHGHFRRFGFYCLLLGAVGVILV